MVLNNITNLGGIGLYNITSNCFHVLYNYVLGNREQNVMVKSTSSQDQKDCKFTSSEIEFARENKDCFRIYVVYGIGSKAKTRMCRIDNFTSQIGEILQGGSHIKM